MAEVAIRNVRFDELDTLAWVIRQSFATVAADFGLTEQNCITNGAFIKTERLVSDWNRGDMMFGLFADGEPIGFMQLSQKDAAMFELGRLAVLPQYRHAGYGVQLLDFARNTVREKGGIQIIIGIIEENTVLKNWYQTYGFVHTGTRLVPHLPFTVGSMELNA